MQGEGDAEKLEQLAVEHEQLKRMLFESEAELERLREVVNTLLDKEKSEERGDVAAESDKEAPRRYWLQEEHDRFLEALQMHGPKAMKAISDHVATRTPVQVRSHAQKYFQRLARISASESASNKGQRRNGGVGSSSEMTDDSAGQRGEVGGERTEQSEHTEQSSDISSPRGGT